MSDATSGPLRDAYEAIHANQLPKAREILRAYMVSQPNDPDAWWLYSYAAETPDEARSALQNVLRLDPMYPGASDLLVQLNQSAGSATLPTQPAGIRKLGDNPAVSTTQTPKSDVSLDDDDFDDLDDLDDEDEDDESGFTRRRVLVALAGFALIVFLVILVFIFLPRRTSAPEPTNVAQVTLPATTLSITPDPSLSSLITITPDEVIIGVSPEPSVEVAVTVPDATGAPVATEDAATISETPSGTEFVSFYTALAAFEVLPNSMAIDQTTIGQTFSGSICLQNQGELRSAIPTAISALASVSPEAPAEAQFIGAKFLNCTDNSLMRYVVVPIEDARAFAAGTLTASQLRGVHRNITR